MSKVREFVDYDKENKLKTTEEKERQCMTSLKAQIISRCRYPNTVRVDVKLLYASTARINVYSQEGEGYFKTHSIINSYFVRFTEDYQIISSFPELPPCKDSTTPSLQS